MSELKGKDAVMWCLTQLDEINSEMSSMVDKTTFMNLAEALTYMRNTRPNDVKITPEELAVKFHSHYEKMAPVFRYETREDTKEFDPTSKNGKLMIAVCEQILMEMRPNDAKAMIADKLDKLITIVTDIAHEQAHRDISGGNWWVKIMKEINSL